MREFVSLFRNYDEASKNVSGTYEDQHPRGLFKKKVAKLSKVRNKDMNHKNYRNLKKKPKNVPF